MKLFLYDKKIVSTVANNEKNKKCQMLKYVSIRPLSGEA